MPAAATLRRTVHLHALSSFFLVDSMDRQRTFNAPGNAQE
jgi:hypothetical protein